MPSGPKAADQAPAAFPALGYKLGDKIATREAYGAALVRVGGAHPGVVAMDGDTKNSTYSEKFYKAFPNRFTECFIAEQNLVAVAIGFGTRGHVPFASTFATFFTRAADQIRVAGISSANLKLVGSHVGVSIGEDGPCQMALEDIAVFRSVAGSAVLYPADAVATEKLLEEMAKTRGIQFLRTSRPKTPVIYGNDEKFPIGGAKVLREGTKATIVSAGVTLFEALKAADQLKAEGVTVTVIDAYSVKPIDEAAIVAAARQSGAILTAEEHLTTGALGAMVAQVCAEQCPVPMRYVGIKDLYSESGTPESLMEAYGLTAQHLFDEVKALIERKKALQPVAR